LAVGLTAAREQSIAGLRVSKVAALVSQVFVV